MIKKELLIGISIVVVFLYLNYCQSKKIEKQNKMIEKFTTTNYDKIFGEESNIEDLIEGKVKKYYGADIDAIRNLGSISEKLASKDGYILPGNITIDGSLKLGGKFNYLPKGSIIAFNGEKAPSGWAICDGKNNTPDLRGKFIYGYSGKGISDKLKNYGGTETVKLTTAQMPRHNHGGAGGHTHDSIRVNKPNGQPFLCSSLNNPRAQMWSLGNGHRHGRYFGHIDTDHDGTINMRNCTRTSNDGGHTHSTEGNSQSHENMPPYCVLLYIIKL